MQVLTDPGIGVVQYLYLLHQRREELVLLRQIAGTAAYVAVATVRGIVAAHLGVIVGGVQQAGVAESKSEKHTLVSTPSRSSMRPLPSAKIRIAAASVQHVCGIGFVLRTSTAAATTPTPHHIDQWRQTGKLLSTIPGVAHAVAVEALGWKEHRVSMREGVRLLCEGK